MKIDWKKFSSLCEKSYGAIPPPVIAFAVWTLAISGFVDIIKWIF